MCKRENASASARNVSRVVQRTVPPAASKSRRSWRRLRRDAVPSDANQASKVGSRKMITGSPTTR